MSVMKYQWRPNARKSIPAEPVGRAIEALGRRLGRPFHGVTAADVVEEARSPESPLHPLFTWDNDAAAEKQRKAEARHLLRSLSVVIVAAEPRTIVANVAVRPLDAEGNRGGRLYIPTTLASRNADLRDQMVLDAIKGLEGWRKRYADLLASIGALGPIDEMLRELNDRIREPVG